MADLLESWVPETSVIIPIRNEAGTIEEAVRRVPGKGDHTEIILVEGWSKDDSWNVAQRVSQSYPKGAVKILRQPGKGKADAVRFACERAQGQYLIILDADLGVDPEMIPAFISPLRAGRCGFVNGVRTPAKRERGSMRLANAIGNTVFCILISLVIRRRIGDALCGTKAFSRIAWQSWSRKTRRWRHLDPFGDFEMLGGASSIGLRFHEINVDYRARRYGETNISRWQDGFRLLMLIFVMVREQTLCKR